MPLQYNRNQTLALEKLTRVTHCLLHPTSRLAPCAPSREYAFKRSVANACALGIATVLDGLLRCTSWSCPSLAPQFSNPWGTFGNWTAPSRNSYNQVMFHNSRQFLKNKRSRMARRPLRQPLVVQYVRRLSVLRLRSPWTRTQELHLTPT